MNTIYYQYLLLQLLFLEANPLGLTLVGVKMTQNMVREAAKGYLGTLLAEISNTGYTSAALTRFFMDTRTLHLWVLSASGPEEFLIRALQYASLETTVFSFGSLGKGSASVALGTLRTLAADNLALVIAHNATRIKNVLKLENHLIQLAAHCGHVGKEKCLELLIKIRGGEQNLSPEMISTFKIQLVDRYNAQFVDHGRVIINNVFREHTTRRYLDCCMQKRYALIASKSATTKIIIQNFNPITLGTFICWSWSLGCLGLEPRTNKLKVYYSTD